MPRAPRLSDIDLSIRVADDERYRRKLQSLRLDLLRMETHLRDVPADGGPHPALCVVFEGVDAAGKGGAIRRLTGRLDPRGFRVHPIGPPSPEEQAHHWLWRFSQRMPGRGEISIFDRSWYGRVLVERVEGFARPKEWRRAYDEIAAFEKAHVKAGVTLLKFWLQISKAEQLRRFRERARDPLKEYKIGPEDWRNRRHWKENARAANDMFERTHTRHAPWTLVSGECKQHARLVVLKEVVRRFADELKRSRRR